MDINKNEMFFNPMIIHKDEKAIICDLILLMLMPIKENNIAFCEMY
ncbi:MAG: hypothetical protein PHT69_03825 [Bacteroidales bacterium]|nr:hypothetical protein [Bacteroidales bacterium]